MPYNITSTEKTRKSASDHETKALLYLMGCRNDSDQIYYFVVDFYNDLTGVSQNDQVSWDLQSKAEKGLSPKEVGESLVTLYKNFLSDFSFNHFISFIGGVSSTLRKNSSLMEFDFENINDESLVLLKQGLKDESVKKTYIDSSKVTNASIDEFVKKVTFVICDNPNEEYVKNLIKLSDRFMPSQAQLLGLFKEIKKEQNSKKDNILSEGITLSSFRDFHNYNKFLKADDVRLWILSRIINSDITTCRPTSFDVVLNSIAIDERSDFIEDCRFEIYRVLFNKNNAKSYWKILEKTFSICSKNIDKNINEIYDLIPKKVVQDCLFLTYDSTRFFISMIKEKIENDN